MLAIGPMSDVQNGHDLVGRGVYHQDLVAHQNELVTAPFRIDGHNLSRKRTEGYALARNAGAERNREVHVVDRLDALALDHRGDLGALLGRELGPGAGLTRRRLRLGLRVHVAVAVAALGVLIAVAAFAALSLHVAVAALAAFGLHVLAALGLGLRAHALRLLTRCSFFGALALGSTGRRLRLGLC